MLFNFIMNTKSKLSRLQCKPKNVPSSKEFERNPEPIDVKKSLNTTPIHRKSYPKDDIDDESTSPFLLRFTQDSCDDGMDVVWDWDSPKSHGKRSMHRKRILHSSPNIPKKHVTCEKTLPRFNSLKAELEQLAYSFSNDQETQRNSHDVFIKPKTPEPPEEDINDLFEDDGLFDEEMIKCSQQIEESINIQKLCTSMFQSNNNVVKLENNRVTIQDDSFDCFLEDIKDDEIELFSQQSNSSSDFDKSTQPLIIEQTVTVTKVSSPRSIARTNSVPTGFLSARAPPSTSSSFQRTKSEDLSNKSDQCSPEEIEKKRLEAQAKLMLKRKEKEIEKKRLEALERLKRNRMQRIMSQNTFQR